MSNYKKKVVVEYIVNHNGACGWLDDYIGIKCCNDIHCIIYSECEDKKYASLIYDDTDKEIKRKLKLNDLLTKAVALGIISKKEMNSYIFDMVL